jgi:hypothetical protein
VLACRQRALEKRQLREQQRIRRLERQTQRGEEEEEEAAGAAKKPGKAEVRGGRCAEALGTPSLERHEGSLEGLPPCAARRGAAPRPQPGGGGSVWVGGR